jgi:hypothetical protein
MAESEPGRRRPATMACQRTWHLEMPVRTGNTAGGPEEADAFDEIPSGLSLRVEDRPGNAE